VSDFAIYPLYFAPSPVLLYLRALRYQSRVFSCCPSLRLHTWSSVFNHMVRLDTYILQDFDFLHLYRWFSRTPVLLFRTRQVVLHTQTPVDKSSNFVMSLLMPQLYQLAAFTC